MSLWGDSGDGRSVSDATEQSFRTNICYSYGEHCIILYYIIFAWFSIFWGDNLRLFFPIMPLYSTENRCLSATLY